jgi:type IV fimbrial biogenesis protein FimT
MCRANTFGLRSKGFTLIELMIVVVIFAILAAVGVPALQRYMADNRTLATAQAFQAGLQSARAEAIRRNQNVTMQLTNDTAWPNATPASLSTSGRNWVVRAPDPANPMNAALGVAVDQRVSDDPAARVTVAGSMSTVTFTPLGTITAAGAQSFDFSHAGYNCVTAGGDFRCKRVRVGVGGQIQLCDPAVAAAATGDSRRCVQ